MLRTNYFTPIRIKMKLFKILFTALFVFAGFNLFAQQDTLISSSGDVIIGEIKSMSRNVLIFDTEYADSDFNIEWDKIKGITTYSPLVVFTENGDRLIGKLKFVGDKDRIVELINSDKHRSINLDEIVKINTYENGFLDRIFVSIDAGYSFAKANNLSQFSMTGRLKYKADKWRVGGGFNNVATSQDNVDQITRNEANIDVKRDVLGKAYLFTGLEFLENSEQKLDLRTTSKLGAGYYFIRNNSLFFQGGVGLANANEKYGGELSSTQNSFEGLGTLEFDAFDIGDFSFRAKVSAFPSFSTKGRVRINSDFSLKYNLPLDFYIKANYIHNYDNKPLNEGTIKADYVFQTSIGWEWN